MQPCPPAPVGLWPRPALHADTPSSPARLIWCYPACACPCIFSVSRFLTCMSTFCLSRITCMVQIWGQAQAVARRVSCMAHTGG